jgi:hypothetical protein
VATPLGTPALAPKPNALHLLHLLLLLLLLVVLALLVLLLNRTIQAGNPIAAQHGRRLQTASAALSVPHRIPHRFGARQTTELGAPQRCTSPQLAHAGPAQIPA